MKPFEGILGNNCELRLVQFLLPLEGIDFNITELAEEIDISRVTVTKVVKKFADWGLLLKRRSGNATYYSINLKSPIVASIQKFNNALIEVMLGDEELYKIHDYWESNKNRPNPSTVGLSRNTCLDAADTTPFTVDCLSPHSQTTQLWGINTMCPSSIKPYDFNSPEVA